MKYSIEIEQKIIKKNEWHKIKQKTILKLF